MGYPVTLVGLENARCVVVGGGKIATRKVTALCEAGATPVVISPTLSASLRCRSERGEIQVIEREYRAQDLEGAWLVVAATDDQAINNAVWREAKSIGCLVNVVDDPAHCNFYAPANVRRGALTISISTGGNSPALARRLREALELEFDASYKSYVALLGELRPLVRERINDAAQRAALWKTLLDSEILELYRGRENETARLRALEIIDSFS